MNETYQSNDAAHEQERAVVAEQIAHRIGDKIIDIDDSAFNRLRAEQREGSTAYWNAKLENPDLSDKERAEAEANAAGTAKEALSQRAIFDPAAREEYEAEYGPVGMSPEEIKAAKERSDSLTRL